MTGGRPFNKECPPSIAIITALPGEYAAVEAILDNPMPYVATASGAMQRYSIGEVTASDGGKHCVVLLLVGDPVHKSADARAVNLRRDFPSIELFIMVGVASGVPSVEQPGAHVRLGDVVVSAESGAIQYGVEDGQIIENPNRLSLRPPASILVEAIKILEVDEHKGRRAWVDSIDPARLGIPWAVRPHADTDVLYCSANSQRRLAHPHDTKRRNGEPRVFIGPIATSNRLLQQPGIRDALRDRFRVRAIELEGSGITDPAWFDEKGYLIIRGVCDYGDRRDEDWQNYAAIVAAAYTRALIELVPSRGPSFFPAARNKVVITQPGSQAGADKSIRAFLSYAREDKEVVLRLYDELMRSGITPWMDVKDLIGGMNWKVATEKALRSSDFFIACLSSTSVSKRGYFQSEVKDALDIFDQKLDSDIYLIPVRLNDCEIPDRLSNIHWIDLFEPGALPKILEAIQAGIQRRGKVPYGTTRELLLPPLETESAPRGHTYLEPCAQPGIHLYLRERDRQVVLSLPAGGKTPAPFLIDQHLITNSQYADFLNSDEIRKLISVRPEDGVFIGFTKEGDRLIAEASRNNWRKFELESAPWGLVYQRGIWTPAPDSEQLPITLITPLGASWYAAWASGSPIEEAREGYGLPTEAQWTTASLWNYAEKKFTKFPWGDDWDRRKLNSLSFWAGADVKEIIATHQPLLNKARPTPVGRFADGAGASGIMDALGNVWEFINQSDAFDRSMIKGGCCVSPQCVFQDAQLRYQQRDITTPWVGFRCCHPLEKG